MSVTDLLSKDPGLTPLTVRHNPTGGVSNCHTVQLTQTATSGDAGVLSLVSANSASGALKIKTPGSFLQFYNAANELKFEITNTGGLQTQNALVISAVTGAPAASSLPLGATAAAANTGIQLLGSFAGGEDNSSGTDSTPRINIYSYQRAATNSFGEIQRMWLMRQDAKAMLAWYGPQLTGTQDHGYGGDRNALTTGVSWKPWAWLGAHYEANDHGSTHGHISIEVPDAAGALQTRFEIQFADRTTGDIGLNKSFIISNDSDFAIRQSGGESFRLVAPAGTEKRIEFMGDAHGDDTTRRWKIRSNSTAESGSNAGSDFQIVRYNDAGVVQDSPIEITRSTGAVTLAPTGGVAITRGSGIALQVTPTATGGQALNVTGTDATARAYQGMVSGDSTNRYVRFVDGKVELGPGNATRDTNLYRSAANTLTTDDLFTAVGVSSTTAGTTAAGTFATSADGTASLGVLVVNPFSVNKRAVDIRLAGDSVTRLRVDMSQGTNSGTITFGNGTVADTNLYRSAADTLKTDDAFVVGGTLAVTGAVTLSSTLGVAGVTTLTGALVVDDANFSVLGVNKGYRFRPLGARLDCEATGSDWIFSVFSGTNFDGTQHPYLRLESGTPLAHACGTWIFTDTADSAAVHTLDGTGNKLGFHGATAIAKQTVTGSRGANAALADLLTKLANLGIITDGTS